MSHESGKIEVVGMTEEQIFFKYARAAENNNNARFMAFYRNPKACWFDDYKEASDEFSLFSETTKAGCL
jgi:chromosomal replication initiation ATPase DnaA